MFGVDDLLKCNRHQVTGIFKAIGIDQGDLAHLQ